VTPAALNRLVLRAPNWLGDAVLALPAMAAIRRHFADADVTVAAPASIAALFREATSAAPDHVLELPSSSRAVTRALAAGRFDAGVLFPNSFRSAWQLSRAGVRERWGYAASGRRLLLTRRITRPKRTAARHHADYYRALVRGLGIDCPEGELPRVAASMESERHAEFLLAQQRCPPGPLVALLPGAANSQAKQWPPHRMAELAARLVIERGVACIVTGAGHDAPAARAIESWIRTHAPAAAPRVIDLVGRTSIGALAAVLGRAAVCVSNDAGGMHLASALGRPVVAIFGPTDERATRPAGDHDLIVEPVFCRPCHLADCPIDHRCMTRITVDRVFGAASARLKGEGAR